MDNPRERELAHQAWLEHSLKTALEPGKEALFQGRAIGLDVVAVFAAGFALGKLQAWQEHLIAQAPTFLREPMLKGVVAGQKAYRPLQRAA